MTDARDPSSTTPGTPASAATTRPAASDHNAEWDKDDGEWRHAPVPEKDEKNPAKSLGEAISNVVTGSDADTSRKAPTKP